MKKFTLLLLSMVMGLAANAAVGDVVTDLSAIDANKAYTLESGRCFLYYNEEVTANVITSTANNYSAPEQNIEDQNQWFQLLPADGGYYLYSVAAAKYIDQSGAFVDEPADVTYLSASGAADGDYLWYCQIGSNGFNTQISGQFPATGYVLNSWTIADAGNTFKIVEAADLTPVEPLVLESGKVYTFQPYNAAGNYLYAQSPEFWGEAAQKIHFPFTDAPTVDNGATWTLTAEGTKFNIQPSGENFYKKLWLNPRSGGYVGTYNSGTGDDLWTITNVEGTSNVFTIMGSSSKSYPYWTYDASDPYLKYTTGLDTPTEAQYFIISEYVEPEPEPVVLGKYLTAQEIRDNAENLRLGILNVTTTGGKYINGEAGTANVSADGTLAAVTDPTDNDVVVLEKAGDNQYYIKREADGKYFVVTAGGNITLGNGNLTATTFGVYGPEDEGYGTVSGFADLYTDIPQELNENMIRFIAEGQYLNGQAYTAVGGLRGGTGAWSFNYVRNADYTEAVDPEPEPEVFVLNSITAEQGEVYENGWGGTYQTINVTVDCTINSEKSYLLYFNEYGLPLADMTGALYTADYNNSGEIHNGVNTYRFIDFSSCLQDGLNEFNPWLVVVDAETFAQVWSQESAPCSAYVTLPAVELMKAIACNPEEGEVESLSRIDVTFDGYIYFMDDSTWKVANATTLVDAEGNVVAKVDAEYDDDWSVVRFILDHEVTEAGTYSMTVPEGLVYDGMNYSVYNEARTFTWTIAEKEVEWDGTVEVSAESASLDQLASNVKVNFGGAKVGVGALGVLGAIFDESGDIYGIVMAGEDYDQFGAVTYGNAANVTFAKVAELKAELVEAAMKKIGGFTAPKNVATVYFCPKSFSVNGETYAPAIVKSFEIAGNGQATSINGLTINNDEPVYDLSGRRVRNASNGLFIQNGKKILK